MNKKEQVIPANPLVEVIGETLERIHCVPADVPNIYAGYKSVVLCFGNGKSIHLDAEMHLCKEGVFPVIRSRDGDWEMIKAKEESETLRRVREFEEDLRNIDPRKVMKEKLELIGVNQDGGQNTYICKGCESNCESKSPTKPLICCINSTFEPDWRPLQPGLREIDGADQD